MMFRRRLMRFRPIGAFWRYGLRRWHGRNAFFPEERLRVASFRPRRSREAGRLLLIVLFCVILLPLLLPLIKLAVVLLFAIGTLAAFLLLLAMIRFLWLWWR
ncbi:MAG TPA: hypothetical protein VIL22_01705 [Paenibacillaceae bacterium]